MIPNLRLQLKFKDMALINRQTLKNYFKKGGFATEKHFVDLIDSSLNSVDDGITKTPEFGVKLSPLKSSSKLLSFFKKITQDQPDFSLNLNSNNSEGLSIDNSENATILKLKKEGNVGIKTNNPNYTLEVNGTIGIKTQVGVFKIGEVPADGQWHDMLSNLDGLNAFEITAKAAGRTGDGDYSITHSIALSAFGGKKSRSKIKATTAYYERYKNKIELRWHGEMHNYSLQVRTRKHYGINPENKEDFLIKFNIINLFSESIES